MNSRLVDLICICCLALIAVGGGTLAVRSSRSQESAIDRKNRAIAARLEELQQAQEVLSKSQSVLNANRAALERLEKRIPSSSSVGDLLSSLDSLAASHNVGLDDVQPGTSVPGEICRRTPMEFQCHGDFAGLHAVLYGLEHMERLVRLEGVRINRRSLSRDCVMEVTCNVYGR